MRSRDEGRRAVDQHPADRVRIVPLHDGGHEKDQREEDVDVSANHRDSRGRKKAAAGKLASDARARKLTFEGVVTTKLLQIVGVGPEALARRVSS